MTTLGTAQPTVGGSSVIENALDSLGSAIDELDGTAGNLIGGIVSGCRPDQPCPTEDAVKVPEPELSPLAAKIAVLTVRVRLISQRLTSVSERVEL